jgi:hypothetical protein
MLISSGLEVPTVNSINGLGEEGSPVTTRDETPEPLNRIVLIIIYE